MRSQFVILLAVCSSIVDAGPIRNSSHVVQHPNFARFFNSTETPLRSTEVPTPTPIISPPVDRVPSSTPATQLSASDSISSSIMGQKQTDAGTASNEGQAAMISASISISLTQSATSSVVLATAPTSSLLMSGPSVVSLTPLSGIATVTTQSAGSLPEQSSLTIPTSGTAADAVNGPSASSPSFAGVSSVKALSAGLSLPNAASSTPAVNILNGLAQTNPSAQSSSPLATSSIGQTQGPISSASLVSTNVAQTSGLSAATVSSRPVSSVTNPAGTQYTDAIKNYPDASNGNLAMAQGFNQIFKTLNEKSPCNPNDQNSAIACVEGQPALCDVDGIYSLLSCRQGQSCYALPYASGQAGINVTCAYPSDAANILSTNASPVSSSPEASVAVAPQTASAIGAHSAQSTQATSASSGAVANSQSTQSTFRSATTFPPSVAAVGNQASSMAQSPGAQSLSQTGDISPSPVEATAHHAAVSMSVPAQSSAIPAAQTGQAGQAGQSKAPQAQTTTQAAPPAASSATADAGLLISFPKALPSAPPSAVNKKAETQSSVPALNPSTSPLALKPSTRAIQTMAAPSPEMAKALADSVPVTSSALPGSPTSSAAGAGITFQPLGSPNNVNANAPVTVTVTVTTTAHDGKA